MAGQQNFSLLALVDRAQTCRFRRLCWLAEPFVIADTIQDHPVQRQTSLGGFIPCIKLLRWFRTGSIRRIGASRYDNTRTTTMEKRLNVF